MHIFAPDAIDVLHQRVAAAVERASAAQAPDTLYWEDCGAQIAIRLAPTAAPMPQRMLHILTRPAEIAGKLGHGPEITHTLLRTVIDATNKQQAIAAWTDKPAWIDALEIAYRFCVSAGSGGYVDLPGSRASVVAAALGRLKAQGFDYQIAPYRVTLSEDALAAACAKVEAAIQMRGGAVVALETFKSLADQGAVYRGLFLFGRKTSNTREPRKATIPWHFLYNLALKHIALPGVAMKFEEWAEIVELARDLAAALDVEAYSQFDGIDINPYNIENAVLDNTFYDELFSFQQWSHEGAAQLFDWWLEAVAANGCTLPIASLAEWRAFARNLLGATLPDEPTPITPKALISADLSESVAADLLRAVSALPSAINANYRTPLDTALRDAPFHPVLTVRPDVYAAQPTGLAARALYEVLFTQMRTTNDKHLERKLGTALETLTERVLESAGHHPTVAGAKYDHPTMPKATGNLEIDIVLENANDVTLIECKRKALTRSARGVSVADALSDLTKGFIEPYIQMVRHEIALKHGPLTLDNGTTITLANRNVTRIAVTMLDHGSLQNRIFIRAILRACAGAKLNSADAANSKKLQHVNETISELWALIRNLAEMAGDDVEKFIRTYEFGTWWLSVDQLSLIAASAGDVPAALAPMRHVTFQTGDLMNEFAYAKNMKGSNA